jgi:hypothetical protein
MNQTRSGPPPMAGSRTARGVPGDVTRGGSVGPYYLTKSATACAEA